MASNAQLVIPEESIASIEVQITLHWTLAEITAVEAAIKTYEQWRKPEGVEQNHTLSNLMHELSDLRKKAEKTLAGFHVLRGNELEDLSAADDDDD